VVGETANVDKAQQMQEANTNLDLIIAELKHEEQKKEKAKQRKQTKRQRAKLQKAAKKEGVSAQ